MSIQQLRRHNSFICIFLNSNIYMFWLPFCVNIFSASLPMSRQLQLRLAAVQWMMQLYYQCVVFMYCYIIYSLWLYPVPETFTRKLTLKIGVKFNTKVKTKNSNSKTVFNWPINQSVKRGRLVWGTYCFRVNFGVKLNTNFLVLTLV